MRRPSQYTSNFWYFLDAYLLSPVVLVLPVFVAVNEFLHGGKPLSALFFFWILEAFLCVLFYTPIEGFKSLLSARLEKQREAGRHKEDFR